MPKLGKELSMDKLKFQERYKVFSKCLDDTYKRKLNISTNELFDRMESDYLTFCDELWRDKIITNKVEMEVFKLGLLMPLQLNRFAALSVYG